jgi:hypothetical protein
MGLFTWPVSALRPRPSVRLALLAAPSRWAAWAAASEAIDVARAGEADLSAVIAEDAVRQARLDLLSAIGQFQ